MSPSQRPFNEDRQCCLQLSRGRRGKRGGGGRAARDLRPFQPTVPPSEGLANRCSIHEWNLPHTWVNLIFPSKPWASRGHLTSGGLVAEESGGDGRKQEEGGQVAEEVRIGREVEVSGAKKI